MAKTRLAFSTTTILEFFASHPKRIWLHSDLQKTIEDKRAAWNLAQSTTTAQFIQFLLESGQLKRIVFPFPAPYRKETRYTWGDVPLYSVLLTLRDQCYFSNYSALFFHGLTEQVPKTHYLTTELAASQSSRPQPLTQDAIDRAFRNKPRTTNQIAETPDFRVCLTQAKNTNALGVIDKPIDTPLGSVNLRLTSLERTLLDAAVRPHYSGGVFEILKAFRNARDQVSPNRLAATLKKLDYAYPYHQAVGFYLQRADYPEPALSLFRLPMSFDFYLSHGHKDLQYIPEWRLHVPRGL